MRRFRPFTPLFVAALLLGACGGSSDGAPSATVSPDEQTLDPTVDDSSAEAALARCLSGREVTGRKVRVVSTVSPITSLIAGVAGDTNVEITGIVPEGTNSHTFEPPPSAAAILERADVVFVNGLGLEDPTLELIANVAPGAVVCEIGTAVLPPSNWLFDFSFPREGGKPNPHIWTNPPMVLSMVTVIRDVLVKANPAGTEQFDENYVKLSVLIEGLDKAMLDATATIPEASRKLLTYHDAYAYFSERYKFTVVGALQPQSFEEPSPQDIATLIEQVRKEGVKAIFGSEVFPSPVLEQIGKETGVRYIDVLRDDDLLGKPGDADHSWAGLMKFNFVTMVEALGGDASALEKFDTTLSVPDKATYAQ